MCQFNEPYQASIPGPVPQGSAKEVLRKLEAVDELVCVNAVLL